jgi:hypothetical protein
MTEDDQSPPPDRRVYVLRLEAASIHQLRAALKTLLPRRALPRGKRGDRAGRPPAQRRDSMKRTENELIQQALDDLVQMGPIMDQRPPASCSGLARPRPPSGTRRRPAGQRHQARETDAISALAGIGIKTSGLRDERKEAK